MVVCWDNPAKTNLQDHARLCKNLACKTCLARARDMSLFLHDSCTILHYYSLQKNVQETPNLQVIILAASLAKSCTIFLARYVQDSCARIVQDCARIVQEKGHIACTCQASLGCKILAQSCMILQVRFCWEQLNNFYVHSSCMEPSQCTIINSFPALHMQPCCIADMAFPSLHMQSQCWAMDL